MADASGRTDPIDEGASGRPGCARCNGTGLIWSECGCDGSSRTLPCSCRGDLARAADLAALRIELAVGVPIAGVAGTLLYLFN